MAGIRSGLPPASCGDEARRLVDHEDSTLQFSRWWSLCAFWVWWFLERATRTIWSWLLPGHLPVVEERPLFGTVCFVLGYPSLQHLCGFSPCVGMLKSFWQNIFARSQTQICFSSGRSLHTFAHLEKQALVDAPCCFPDCFIFLPCWSALIAFSFSLWFLTFSQLCYLIFVNSSYNLGHNCWENCILGQHFSKHRSCTGSSLSPFPWKQCCCVFKRKRDPWAFVGSNIELGEGVFFPQRRRFRNTFVA